MLSVRVAIGLQVAPFHGAADGLFGPLVFFDVDGEETAAAGGSKANVFEVELIQHLIQNLKKHLVGKDLPGAGGEVAAPPRESNPKSSGEVREGGEVDADGAGGGCSQFSVGWVAECALKVS
eukprot:595169-Pyramimonas_sp.AAC.2